MLTNFEKSIVKKIQNTRIPAVYKEDLTDNILYIEHVEFDLCKILLKNKKESKEFVQEEFKEYARFLTQLDISNYDDDTKTHLLLIMEVVNMFFKYNL